MKIGKNLTEERKVIKYWITELTNNLKNCYITVTSWLIQVTQCTLSAPFENIRKSYGFLMFSGSRERVHWEQMSQLTDHIWDTLYKTNLQEIVEKLE